MEKLYRKLVLCLLMMLLVVLMTSYPSFADWELVPTGWTAPRPGYWGEIEDGRDTLAIIRTSREEATAWKNAFESAVAENRTFQENMEQRFNAFENSITIERKEWKKEIIRAKAPGFGFFAGPAYSFRSNDIEIVAGFGLVWKIW